MIKVLLFALVLILCWPIALVVGLIWALVATVSLTARLIMAVIRL